MNNNQKATKRALLTSVMALVMCVVMLVGTTFAWFTDTASTGVNKIQAGNLDVKLEYKNSEQTAFAETNTNTKVFKDGALWEPGHVEYVVLKISNAGNLALKYKLGINIASETGSTNVFDKSFKLSDYIKFAVIDGESTNLANRDALVTEAAAAGDHVLNAGYTDEGHLLKDADKVVTLVVWMPTDVGNEANHKTGVDAPSIDLGINVVATQYTYEYDSFGNDYDANAAYPITDSAALNEALTTGGSIALGADAKADSYLDISNNTTISLGGNTLTIGDNTKLTGGSDLTVSGGKVLRETYSGYVDVRPGTTTNSVITYTDVVFDNTYKTKTYGPCTDRVESALEFCPENGGSATFYFKNCTFKNSQVLFEGLSGKNGSFTATFENCTFNNLGTSAGIAVDSYLTGTITVKDCTFNLTATATMNAIASSNSVVTWNFEGTNMVNGYAATASGEDGTVDQIKVMNPSVKVYSINTTNGTVVNGLDTVTVTGSATK